jgi:hypothetical protein
MEQREQGVGKSLVLVGKKIVPGYSTFQTCPLHNHPTHLLCACNVTAKVQVSQAKNRISRDKNEAKLTERRAIATRQTLPDNFWTTSGSIQPCLPAEAAPVHKRAAARGRSGIIQRSGRQSEFLTFLPLSFVRLCLLAIPPGGFPPFVRPSCAVCKSFGRPTGRRGEFPRNGKEGNIFSLTHIACFAGCCCMLDAWRQASKWLRPSSNQRIVSGNRA